MKRGTPVSVRFWAKVKGGDVDTCWIWQAALNHAGYGNFWPRHGHMAMAHRWAYEELRAPIPPGLHLDHLCRTPACVNPWHLEPVTPWVNVVERGIGGPAAKAAQTHCIRGHEFTPENTWVRRTGQRQCLVCNRERRRKPKPMADAA